MALPTEGYLYMFGKHCVGKLCLFRKAGVKWAMMTLKRMPENSSRRVVEFI